MSIAPFPSSSSSLCSVPSSPLLLCSKGYFKLTGDNLDIGSCMPDATQDSSFHAICS
ncbi:hypothetical protein A2U01_0015283, partial [Trifolium medium]|nr:hypothetical protein [Trifolium medium]